MLIRIGPTAGLLIGFCVLSAPASAQIYSWTDANGRMIVSNTQRPAFGENVKSYAVPGANDFRTTLPVPVAQSHQYDDLIQQNAQNSAVRPDLVRAVIQVESAYNPAAKSPKGALGLMQLMPATIQQFGVRNPFNPAENIRAGVAYLRALLDRYSDNEKLALAAYNAGPGAVDKHGEAIPPYRETQQYVSRVSEIAGRAIQIKGTTIFTITQVIDGKTYVLMSTDRDARINPASLPQADPAGRTPAQVLQSSAVFQSR